MQKWVIVITETKMRLKFHYAQQNKKSPIVNSIVRASDILKSLGQGAEMLTEISNIVNLNKATVYRLLKTLRVSGFVAQDPVTQRYYLGHMIAQLASSPTILHERLAVCAFDEMKHLWDLSGETVALHIKVGAQRMILEELPSKQHIRLTLGKGFIVPLYTGGAAGKVLLSQLPESERQMILNCTKLVSMITNKVIDKEALLNEVKKVEKEGYAISFGETIQGSAGIAVPVKNYVCPVALGIFGPEVRFRRNLMNFLKELKDNADRITRKFIE